MRGDKARGDGATVLSKFQDNRLQRAVKFQIPSSKFQDLNSKSQVATTNFMRGDKARGDGATVLCKFQDNRLQWACKFQVPSRKF
jgi:hypothetical protein